jgi:hypothetical protein
MAKGLCSLGIFIIDKSPKADSKKNAPPDYRRGLHYFDLL